MTLVCLFSVFFHCILFHCLFSWLVAVNKMVCHFWHQFLTQFSLLFQMVPFFFLSMAALRTTNTKLSDWLLELFQPIRLWLSELPYRAKWMVPSERALKTKSETGVKSFTPFCLGSSLRKTNSAPRWGVIDLLLMHFIDILLLASSLLFYCLRLPCLLANFL